MKKFKYFSFIASTVLLVIATIAMALATFVESATSTEMARRIVYNATWFEVVLTLLTINIFGSMFYYRSFSWKKITVPVFHLAFVLIMFGAFFTRYTGVEGSVHIREGKTSDRVIVGQRGHIKLPFTFYLEDFVLERYPGSNSPSSYSSYVKVMDAEEQKSFDYHIYMNNILKYRGWRFFQTSYDQDEKGTILTASRDVIGTPLTYAGYFLTVVAMFLSLFMPGAYFRKQLKKLNRGALLIIMAFLPIAAIAQPENSKFVPVDKANDFGSLVFQDTRGRMKVLNTHNKEFMRKIYGDDKMDGYSADQVVLSLLSYPGYWKSVPMLKVKNSEAREALNMDGKWLSLNDLFVNGNQYILSGKINNIFIKPVNQRSKLDKAFLELDDRANILSSFITGNGLRIFPVANDENNTWYSPGRAWMHTENKEDSLFLKHIFNLYLQEVNQGVKSDNYRQANEYLQSIKIYQKKIGEAVYPGDQKLRAELFYNHFNVFDKLKLLYIISGFVLLILVSIALFKGITLSKWVLYFFISIGSIYFILHTLGIALRWYIGGFVPLSNAYETMVFISWVSIITGIIAARKIPILLALSNILSFAFLLVAGFNSSNPEIGNLVPVLKSPWLSIHVAVITSSYALFALVMLLALVNMVVYSTVSSGRFMFLSRKTDQLAVVSQILLIVGLYLMTIGTIFGAVWANESWGRYWGWDPKETWALISIIIYAFVSHMRLIKGIKSAFWYDFAAFWAFSSILMTFFGVNYFLTGMHSYAGTQDAVVPSWLLWVVIVLLIFTTYSGYRYHKYVSAKNE